ncbi:MAG: hypothetical protein CME61_05815 [Halobacteriovoraceae bacterium]|nr:hypothetical protein [Halobacteriovoraceae bacterium]
MFKKLVTFLSLFGSLSTLLCCALPVTLVTIGMGASFASLTTAFPQIIWLTNHKEELFIITAILLMVSYFMMKRSEKMACPIDLDQREMCQTSKSTTNKVFWATVIVYVIGLLFSYVIPKIIY